MEVDRLMGCSRCGHGYVPIDDVLQCPECGFVAPFQNVDTHADLLLKFAKVREILLKQNPDSVKLNEIKAVLK